MLLEFSKTKSSLYIITNNNSLLKKEVLFFSKVIQHSILTDLYTNFLGHKKSFLKVNYKIVLKTVDNRMQLTIEF